MECFICSEKLKKRHLCNQCSNLVDKMLETKSNIIKNPEWINHCLICGEYEERVIVDVSNCGPICDKCIRELRF
jgi:hypothetical protein